MNWLDDVVTRLAAAVSWGYHVGSPSATEPAALTALALIAHRQDRAAAGPLAWLLSLQATDGSLGIDAAQSTPGWPTSLAVLAWHAAQGSPPKDQKRSTAIDRALAWILQTEGASIEITAGMGHDSTIRGWPWVEGTHSWVEPTAMHLLALKHTGHGDHARARDAVRLLQDRLLDGGGCNYGNTVVFKQQLRPHVQPTGLALLALGGEDEVRGQMEKSVSYLERELPRQAATDSLCYGLLGLAAQQSLPAPADAWLAAASRRTISRGPSSYKLALLALAGLGASCPLVPAARVRAAS
jgi:hypothetical protein